MHAKNLTKLELETCNPRQESAIPSHEASPTVFVQEYGAEECAALPHVPSYPHLILHFFPTFVTHFVCFCII